MRRSQKKLEATEAQPKAETSNLAAKQSIGRKHGTEAGAQSIRHTDVEGFSLSLTVKHSGAGREISEITWCTYSM